MFKKTILSLTVLFVASGALADDGLNNDSTIDYPPLSGVGLEEVYPGHYDSLITSDAIDFIVTDYSLIDVGNNLEFLNSSFTKNWSLCDAYANSITGQIGSCAGREVNELRFSMDAGWDLGNISDIFALESRVVSDYHMDYPSSTFARTYAWPLAPFIANTFGVGEINYQTSPDGWRRYTALDVYTKDALGASASTVSAFYNEADADSWQFTTLLSGRSGYTNPIEGIGTLYVRSYDGQIRGAGLLNANEVNDVNANYGVGMLMVGVLTMFSFCRRRAMRP